MSKFDELEHKVRHYRWLRDIERIYTEMLDLINKEKEYFTIEGFSYSARGDTETFDLNPHRTIPYVYIRDGLEAARDNIRKELSECEQELKEWL